MLIRIELRILINYTIKYAIVVKCYSLSSKLTSNQNVRFPYLSNHNKGAIIKPQYQSNSHVIDNTRNIIFYTMYIHPNQII